MECFQVVGNFPYWYEPICSITIYLVLKASLATTKDIRNSFASAQDSSAEL
jgi:hypothetical protein